MTFKWFKKHEKPFLWATVIFTIVVFATFSGFDDLRRMMAPTVPDVAGTFKVATTGEERVVGLTELNQVRRAYARLYGGRVDVDDDMVWSHIIMVADAVGAGVHVADSEVGQLAQQLVGQGQPIAKADYQRLVVGQLGFASLRSFESFLRELLMASRWQEVLTLEAAVVPVEDTYKRWSIDNERFDFEALVFADLEPESIPDPGDGELRTYFDALSPARRDRTFADPARHDIVYGWIALDADLQAVPEDVRTELSEPAAADVELRFERVRAVRFPEVEELDADTRARLADELRIIDLTSRAHAAFLGGEAKDKAAFLDAMTRHGLAVVDPEGLLGPSELEALQTIGSPVLPSRLRGSEAGTVRYVPSFSAEDQVTQVVFVEAVQAERPLAFEEARDQVLQEWRKERVARAANDFREALAAAARALPEAQEAIAPLEQAAREGAEARIAAATEALDEAGRQAIVEEELERADAGIRARLAAHEHLVWDAQVALLPADIGRQSFQDVSKNRRAHAGEGVDTTSFDYFLKTNLVVFQQDVGGITPVLRHAASKQSAIVKVTGRRTLELDDMFADEEGLEEARQKQSLELRSQFQQTLVPARIMADHGLLVAKYDEAEA